MAFGLLGTGFNRKRLPDVRAALIDAWRAKFGDNADTDSDTPDGQLIDIAATEIASVWEVVEDAHLAAFFQSARGVSLALAAEDIGLAPIPAASSKVDELFLYGTATTTITLGAIVSTVDQSDPFNIDTAATIAALSDQRVVEILDVTPGNTYRITIDGNDHDHVAGGGQTVQDVRDALVVAVNAGPTVAIANSGGDRPPDDTAILVLTGVLALVVTVFGTTSAEIDLFNATTSSFTAQVTGPVSALAGTLNTIDTPISGWEGATNIEDADEGRNVESDAEFRIRLRLLLRAVGSATPDAITARLLEITIANGFDDDVDAARVFENTSDVVDGDGRPPHSYEAVVLGGTDAQVAQKIWDHKPAGIKSFGTETVAVVDILGKPHTVSFSRATELFAHLLITVTKGEDFPTTPAESTIATQIVADVAKFGDANLSLGNDFNRVAVNGTILDAIGGASPSEVESILITTGTTPLPNDPTPPLFDADLVADPDAIVRFDTSRIAVVFV